MAKLNVTYNLYFFSSHRGIELCSGQVVELKEYK